MTEWNNYAVNALVVATMIRYRLDGRLTIGLQYSLQ